MVIRIYMKNKNIEKLKNGPIEKRFFDETEIICEICSKYFV